MTHAAAPEAPQRKRESLEHEVAWAVASISRGTLLGEGALHGARAELEGLAATLPELFGTVDPSCLDGISERLCGERGALVFSEIMLLSENHLHLIQPLTRRPGVALLAVSSATQNVGLVLSIVHARAAELERA